MQPNSSERPETPLKQSIAVLRGHDETKCSKLRHRRCTDGPAYLRRLRSVSILPPRMEGLLQVTVLKGREQGLHVGEAGPVCIWRCGHQGI